MNTKLLVITLSATVVLQGVSSLIGQTVSLDLKAVPEGKGWKGNIEAAKSAQKGASPAVEFNKPGEKIVWLEGFDFTEGSIEFDAKGRSGPPQSSFVGVVFRVVDGTTHDKIYFRPFNFRAVNPENKSHAVQYVSEPSWPWPRLRKEKPGQFEKPLDPAPDGDEWFHAKIVLEKRQVRVFVNDASRAIFGGERTQRAQGRLCRAFLQRLCRHR